MKNIVIIGAGDLGKEVVWLIDDINKVKPTYVILGFLDEDEEKVGKQFCGYKVLGKENEIKNMTHTCGVIAIQDGVIRQKIRDENRSFNEWETIIHPSSVIARSSKVGRGSIIFPQVTVSADSKLGEFGLYYIHSTICNDCKIDDYVSIMSGSQVSERVSIGEASYLAAGTTVYPNVTIGREVRVGVGATVSKDVNHKSEIVGASSRNAFFK